MSEAAVSYAFEQLEPSEPPPRDAPAKLLAQAAAEAQMIRERAREDGHAEGLAAGREEGRTQMAHAAGALEQALEELHARGEEVAEAVERAAIELAIALAGKIVAGALQARPELVVEAVQGALRRVSGQRGVAILLNPADVELVREALGDLRRQAGALEPADLQPDQRVPRGGAIVRTAEGEVDVRLATQLERAREAVAADLQREQAPA